MGKVVRSHLDSSNAASVGPALSGADIVLVDGGRRVIANDGLLNSARSNPIVVAMCSPYGQNSPYHSLCEDELFLAALSGIASETPEEFEDRTSERPMQMYAHQASLLGGLTLAVACLQALRTVRRTNQAVVIDFGVLDAVASVPLISQAAGFAKRRAPNPPSMRPRTVPRGFLRCEDGYVYTQGGDDNWKAWAELVGRSDWNEPPWDAPDYRQAHWDEADDVITSWLLNRPASVVYRECQERGVTAFPVHSISQVLSNPQINHRQVVRSTSEDGSLFHSLRSPIRFFDHDHQ
ncbi:MAG: CoA transferase [Dehalococcoidia bacterium]